MSTPTTSTLNGDAATGQPVQTLTQTSDDSQVSKLGVKQGSESLPDTVTSGMTASSQVNVGTIKPVDRKTVQGSYAGDSRADRSNAADASVSKIANPPNPREEARQAPLSGKQTPTSAPITTANVEQVGD